MTLKVPSSVVFYDMILHESDWVIWGKAAAFLPGEACGDRLSKPDRIPSMQGKLKARRS